MGRGTLLAAALAGILPFAAAAPARAADFGIRGGVYSFRNGPDKPFAGVELLFYGGNGIYFNPNVEYVFVENGRYWTFNFDGHWDLPTHGAPYLWIGGGLAVRLVDPDGAASTTKAYGNVLAGIGFRTDSHVVPYIQVKLITTNPVTLVAAGGIRF